MASPQLEHPNLPANHYNNLEPQASIRKYILSNMDEIINYYNENIEILHGVYQRNFSSNGGYYYSSHFPQIDMSGGLMIHDVDEEYIKESLTKFADIAPENHSPEDIESQLLLSIGVALRQNPYNNEMIFNVRSEQDKFILQMLIRYILKLKVLKIYDEVIERERVRMSMRVLLEENLNDFLAVSILHNSNIEQAVLSLPSVPSNSRTSSNSSFGNDVPIFGAALTGSNYRGNGKKNKKFLKKKSKKKKQKRSKKNKKSKKKRKYKKSKKKKQKKSH